LAPEIAAVYHGWMKRVELLLVIVVGSFGLSGSEVVAAEGPFAFEAETIDEGVEIGYGLAIGDVDGDGKDDIVLADKTELVWYRNPDWTRLVIAKNLTLKDNVCLAAKDLDGDGKVELAAGANWNPGETSDEKASGSIHVFSRPDDVTKRWRHFELPHEPTVHRMHWVPWTDGSEKERHSLVVLPLHGRGNVKGEGESGVRVYAYDVPVNGADWGVPFSGDVF
jgi:hypothetical protein